MKFKGYIISSRVDVSVKVWVDEMAKKIGISTSEFIYAVLSMVREKMKEEKMIEKIKEQVRENREKKLDWELMELGL
jgi:antitoxin component of RelBE/YafQ-DinJ toxin-antitoxin module